MRRTAVLAVALFVLQVSAVRAETPRRLAGMPLADALSELRLRGLPVVYSSALVRPEMRVLREPAATLPGAILEEILRPHGLRVSSGPHGHLVVVAAAAEPPAQPETSPLPVFLDEVVVTPGRIRILDERMGSAQFLGRTEIDRMPRPGDDLLWVTKRLPGVATSDVSAELRVRGGDADEILVLLDGVELYEPFHLKDFLKVFSILDASAAGVVDVHTGGFPAEYGGRMGGVIEISSRAPVSGNETVASAGTTHAAVLSTGTAGAGKTQWLVNVRGWYPDVLLEPYAPRGSSVSTKYFDVLARLSRRIGDRATLSAGLLAAGDDLGYGVQDADGSESAEARYRSGHAWLSLESRVSEALRSRTTLSAVSIERDRTGAIFDRTDGTIDVDDGRTSSVAAFRQEWTFATGDRRLYKAGFDVKRQQADYDYELLEVSTDPDVVGDGPPLRRTVTVRLQPSGFSFSGWAANRFRLGSRAVVEAGLRWDRPQWIAGSQLAPRLNVVYALSPELSARAAWGRYHQWQQLNELQVEDGVDRFHPAQTSEQWLLEIERRLGPLTLRAGAYRKELSHVRPRFENLFSTVELLPETETDRVLVAPERARSSGLEFLAAGDGGGPLAWWVSYALARAEDVIDGTAVPRSWDQRHAASYGVTRVFASGWDVHLGGSWHTGWPTTEMTGRLVGDDPDEPEIELVRGPRNGARLPSYLRFDARVTRTMETRRGTVSVSADLLNATGRSNVCCIDDFHARVTEDGRVEVTPERRHWPRFLPSANVRWRF